MAALSPLRLLSPLALGAALLLGAPGCQPASSDEAGPARRAQEIRIANALTTEALVLNAIATNPTANEKVATSALRDAFSPASGDTYLHEQLLDADAQRFMEYVVGCALAPGQTVDWPDPLAPDVTLSWGGSAGLCPEWATEPPSEQCLQRVSACVLARNNALGRRVELSLRGEDSSALRAWALEALTPPALYEPLTGEPVASFRECASAASSASRDCGWTPDALGRCEPRQRVRLGAGGPAPDACGGATLGHTLSGRAVLRVCEGLAGCDTHSERLLAFSQGSCGNTPPAVSFTCPASGAFNVMVAPWDSTASAATQVEVESATPARTRYRLSEKEAFPLREGAFYGTLFDSTALSATVAVEGGVVQGKGQVVKDSLFQRMYTCYDAAWVDGPGYALHRVCALPGSGENCAARVTGPCVDPQSATFPASMCESADGPLRVGDGDFQGCRDSSATKWTQPVTVFLGTACGLMPSGLPELCYRTQ